MLHNMGLDYKFNCYNVYADINECLSNSGGCAQTCINTDGSFRCMCDEGYTLSSDGRTCIDIDECSLGTHECQHICENTAGGFRCLCRQGYQLNSDNTTCSGNNNNNGSHSMIGKDTFIKSATLC